MSVFCLPGCTAHALGTGFNPTHMNSRATGPACSINSFKGSCLVDSSKVTHTVTCSDSESREQGKKNERQRWPSRRLFLSALATIRKRFEPDRSEDCRPKRSDTSDNPAKWPLIPPASSSRAAHRWSFTRCALVSARRAQGQQGSIPTHATAEGVVYSEWASFLHPCSL